MSWGDVFQVVSSGALMVVIFSGFAKVARWAVFRFKYVNNHTPEQATLLTVFVLLGTVLLSALSIWAIDTWVIS